MIVKLYKGKLRHISTCFHTFTNSSSTLGKWSEIATYFHCLPIIGTMITYAAGIIGKCIAMIHKIFESMLLFLVVH